MSYDINAINFVKAIRMITNQPKRNNMLFGEVVSVEPLKIDIGNDVVLTKKFLYLGQMCRPHKVTIPHSHLVNAFVSEKTKAIKTTLISAGTATNVDQKGKYNVKTQKITVNKDKGVDERELQTSEKSDVDLGGATLDMSVNVTGSNVTVMVGEAPATGNVTSTTDLSTFTPTDNGHIHIIPEHSTQDVHFPGTDYEESVTMEIYPRLKVGDIVLLFAMNDFQMYYVAERVEKAEQTS